MARIDVVDLSIDFPIYHGNSRSLKRSLFAAATGVLGSHAVPPSRFGQDKQHRVVVRALRDISFSLTSGDRLGLVGRNGAGKTTLLRALAGIYEPAGGHLRVAGRMGVLLDTSMGMNPELTGRENIMLRGLYFGMSKAEVKRLEEDVQEFANLGEFMDLPMRFYSTGMGVRLSFAMATSIRPQVLLMDEWFLAGDADFMVKARARLEDMVRGADIVVLSSHATPVMQEWCNRVLWMDQGCIIQDGAPELVLDAYLNNRFPTPSDPTSSDPATPDSAPSNPAAALPDLLPSG
jgi:lipopolysaccharide transport system ATP-binding protein